MGYVLYLYWLGYTIKHLLFTLIDLIIPLIQFISFMLKIPGKFKKVYNIDISNVFMQESSAISTWWWYIIGKKFCRFSWLYNIVQPLYIWNLIKNWEDRNVRTAFFSWLDFFGWWLKWDCKDNGRFRVYCFGLSFSSQVCFCTCTMLPQRK